MQFVQHDLGYRNGGELVEVHLAGSAANVRLMDSSNFSNYKSGRQYRYHGGRSTRSLVRMAIPSPGHWFVAVDLQGLSGNLKSSARVLDGTPVL